MADEELDLDLGSEGDDLGDGVNAKGDLAGKDKDVDLGTDEGGEGEDEPKITQKELQRRIKQAQKKHEAELARIKAENQQEVKKATMTQAQKKAYEIEERERLLEERELELNSRELKAGIKTKLAEKGLPDTFTDTLVVLGDESLIDAKIEELENHVSALVNARVKDKISQPEPNVEGKGNVKGMLTKEEFRKLGYEERVRLYRENKDLYKKLI